MQGLFCCVRSCLCVVKVSFLQVFAGLFCGILAVCVHNKGIFLEGLCRGFFVVCVAVCVHNKGIFLEGFCRGFFVVS